METLEHARHSERSHQVCLKIRPGSKSVKQRLRRFDEEKHRAIGEEIAKLLAAGFIKEAYHPEWLIRQSCSCTKKEWEMENVC